MRWTPHVDTFGVAVALAAGAATNDAAIAASVAAVPMNPRSVRRVVIWTVYDGAPPTPVTTATSGCAMRHTGAKGVEDPYDA